VTFAAGIRVRNGMVALADTRIVRGDETSTKAKLSVIEHHGRGVFVMTSGLRSIRDKAVLRLQAELAAGPAKYTRLHELASALGDQFKQIRAEDGASLRASDLAFNAHAILGGQLPDDDESTLALVYPEGNWIVATEDAPYFLVGRSAYGRPILDRLLGYDTDLGRAASLAYLAFEATQASVVDVGYPFDLVLLDDTHEPTVRRFTADELEPVHRYWNDSLRTAVDNLPVDWLSATAPRTNQP
jgi:putative proteasome-type protease